MLTAILMMVLLVLIAIALDTGRWYIEASKVQGAADAAAMAGVTWLPNDYVSAQTTAAAISEDNGYPNSGTSSVVTARPKNSQLLVTVSSTMGNIFGSIFGNSTTTISRTAVADFQAPTIMGSPCNALGNQPDSTAGAALPAGTVIPNATTQGGYVTCQQDPGFWLRIAGPGNSKSNGDRYATKQCGSAVGCTGSLNAEYIPEGYFFNVRVTQGAVGRPLTLQIYDPSYIDTGASCSALTTAANGMNPYVPGTSTSPASPNSAKDRYGSINSPSPWTSTTNPATNNPNPFCSGDNNPDSGSEGYYTSYILRSPTETYNPSNGMPVNGCTKQFGYQTSAPTLAQLTESNGGYNAAIAKTFHQWVDLCTFTPANKGDYYLQVRTNLKVPTGMTADPSGAANTSVYRVADGGANLANPVAFPVSSTLSESNTGHNIFSLRIATNSGGADSVGAAVAMSGYERFPIYSNANGAQEMNLIQVPENTSGIGRTFDFTFFDVSDYTGSATLKVVGPKGSAWETGLTGCSLTGVTTTTGTSLSNCSVTLAGGVNNGKIGTMTVPIPTTYECTAATAPALGDCWMRVIFTIAAGANEDTTWDAGINGDPVRLVQ